MRNRRAASRALGLVLLSSTLALTACTSTSPGGEDGAAASTLPTGGSSDPAAVASPETVPSTTVAPATTVPPTTAAPVVTAAPTTLAPPPPPPSTLPASYEPIAPTDVPLAAVGSGGGAETARVQRRLLDLGFWLEGVDGSYGLTTRQAVMAFQKYVGLPANGSVDGETAAQLSAQPEQAHATADAGTLIEVDKAKQLLFMVVDGRTQWIFNTSTANGQPYEEEDQNTPGEIQKGVAITPDGLHKVNRER
ncbi:MAG: peptidoglycan-binding domain-containing protein, partial [Ilumatobacteraceae bacterium]